MKNYIITDKNIDEIIIFHSPVLYNLDNMLPFISIPKPRKILKSTIQDYCKIFIVIPYKDPILRGQILDSCLTYIKNRQYFFILIGDTFGHNNIKTSTLAKRYLLTRGVKSDYITKSAYDKFPDCITEAISLLEFITDLTIYQKYDIFVAAYSHHLEHILRYFRFKQIKFNPKLQYICEE